MLPPPRSPLARLPPCAFKVVLDDSIAIPWQRSHGVINVDATTAAVRSADNHPGHRRTQRDRTACGSAGSFIAPLGLTSHHSFPVCSKFTASAQLRRNSQSVRPLGPL